MSSETTKTALLEFVSLCNDQTDGLVGLLSRENPNPVDISLAITHLKLLQRSLAKAVDQEIEYSDRLDAFLMKVEHLF